ncbi:MAG: sugar kinase [Pseudomonadota bacterium]
MADILCLGEPMVEFSHRGGDTYVEGFGGDVSNVAVAAARQGASAGMIAHIGTDAFGDKLMNFWKREGVSARAIHRSARAPTGIYFIHHDTFGHNFSYRRAGSAASLMGPEDVPAEAIRAAKILHLSGISLAVSPSSCDACFAAMKIAREAGVLVSIDTNLRTLLWPVERAAAVTHAAMRWADIALPGLDDAKALSGLDDPHEIVGFYQAMGPKVVALTLGAEGALVADAEGLAKIPARPANLVDASGAGDCFDGAFLSRLVAGDDARAAGRYAVVAASLSTEGHGAIPPIPRADDVRRAAKNHAMDGAQ